MNMAIEKQGWQLGFETVAREHPDEVALEIDGEIPAGLEGVHYRIGGARHDVYGERSRHWFDGDGMVQAFRFDNGRILYRSRFVATQKKRDEDAARRRLYAGFRTPAKGGPLARLKGAAPLKRNTANTNIVLHAGHLFALCESGQPYRLDPVTLETLGSDNLDVIPADETFIAHPKLDPATGELWNIGFRLAPSVRVALYKRDHNGETKVVARTPMPFPTRAHDFALTPTKAIIIASPLVAPDSTLRNLSAILRGKSVFDIIRWRPDLGTVMIVIDRHSGRVTLHKTDAFLLSHTVNAFDKDGDVVIDACIYPDADFVLRLFADFLDGAWSTIKEGRPERLRIKPNGDVERHMLADMPFDFPRVAARSWLRPTERIYGTAGYLGDPVSLDVATGKSTRMPLQPDRFAGEPVPVPKPGATSDADAWLLIPILDTKARRSELWIADGADLGAPSLARACLPTMMPFDFHGSWVPQDGGPNSLP